MQAGVKACERQRPQPSRMCRTITIQRMARASDSRAICRKPLHGRLCCRSYRTHRAQKQATHHSAQSKKGRSLYDLQCTIRVRFRSHHLHHHHDHHHRPDSPCQREHPANQSYMAFGTSPVFVCECSQWTHLCSRCGRPSVIQYVGNKYLIKDAETS